MEILSGGNSNQVIKQGNSVLRNTGAWSPFVHQLLRYLTAAGFTQSPVFLGQEGAKERLSFVEGEVGNYPLKPYMQSESILIEAAQLLRRLHDITQNFCIPPSAQFQLQTPTPYEVICHNDFAPYNLVFRDEHIVGIIDFDTAAPGSRLWDIAYAVYRFVPLANDDHCRATGWNPIPDRLSRLKLFCDAYGLQDRERLIPMVVQRLESLVAYMQRHNANLDHIPIYLADLQYLADNQAAFMGVTRTIWDVG
ncbi:MAG: aminoglycoside phosphotransferase family protein [Anaerolineae bacterium]|nr:aminoglycoside phosphotransferase family protein [Anaerolineae bacterium]